MTKKIKRSAAKHKVEPNTLKRTLLTIIAVILVFIVLGFFAYSTVLFKNSNYEQRGFITCNKENTICEESKHIHADIEVSFCGKDIQFPKETDNTYKQHTHKERNKLHWHARISLDPETQTYIDATPRRLAAFFEQMNTPIPTSCPSNPTPSVSVKVNDKEETEAFDYIWQDGDRIHVIVE